MWDSHNKSYLKIRGGWMPKLLDISWGLDKSLGEEIGRSLKECDHMIRLIIVMTFIETWFYSHIFQNLLLSLDKEYTENSVIMDKSG